MIDTEKIINDLIALGHDPEIVARAEKTASSLRKLLDDHPTPPPDDLKAIFEKSK